MRHYAVEIARGTIVLFLLALTEAGTASAAPKGSPWGEKYFPNVELVTHEGRKVKFYDDLVRDKHVVVSFVYTRCTKICGLINAKLASVQRELGDRVGKDIFFYSISLEPEHDTPEVLKKYAEAFKAKPGWTFLTGKKEDIQLLRRKFGDLTSVEDHSAKINIGNDAAGQWWTTSALDNPKYLATVIGEWMDPASAQRSAAPKSYTEAPRLVPSKGQKLFHERCIACHLANGESVGPDLRGVVARRGREWLTRWLRAPEKLIAAKDPIALELLSRANNVPMPNLSLSESDVNELIRFMEGRSEPRPPGERTIRSATGSGAQ